MCNGQPLDKCWSQAAYEEYLTCNTTEVATEWCRLNGYTDYLLIGPTNESKPQAPTLYLGSGTPNTDLPAGLEHLICAAKGVPLDNCGLPPPKPAVSGSNKTFDAPQCHGLPLNACSDDVDCDATATAQLWCAANGFDSLLKYLRYEPATPTLTMQDRVTQPPADARGTGAFSFIVCGTSASSPDTCGIPAPTSSPPGNKTKVFDSPTCLGDLLDQCASSGACNAAATARQWCQWNGYDAHVSWRPSDSRKAQSFHYADQEVEAANPQTSEFIECGMATAFPDTCGLDPSSAQPTATTELFYEPQCNQGDLDACWGEEGWFYPDNTVVDEFCNATSHLRVAQEWCKMNGYAGVLQISLTDKWMGTVRIPTLEAYGIVRPAFYYVLCGRNDSWPDACCVPQPPVLNSTGQDVYSGGWRQTSFKYPILCNDALLDVRTRPADTNGNSTQEVARRWCQLNGFDEANAYKAGVKANKTIFMPSRMVTETNNGWTERYNGGTTFAQITCKAAAAGAAAVQPDAQASPPAPRPDPTASPPPSSTSPIGAIVGGVVGGLGK